MIGWHFQYPVRDWPKAIKNLPVGTWMKSVNDMHMCRDFKKHNPGVKVVFRYEYNDKQHLGNQTDTTLTSKARTFFKAFIDDTFFEQELYLFVDAIEEWNEYLGDSQSEEERSLWVRWCDVVNKVWYDEYRSKDYRLSHIKLVSCNTAIGNSIDLRFAKIVKKYDGILGYHNYTLVKNGVIPTDEWTYYSGRWVGMDQLYVKNGIKIPWLMTEGGPFRNVYDGWKKNDVYNGDLNAHIEGQLKYQLDRCSAWNKSHDGRLLGQVLFTVANDDTWAKYNYDTAEMIKMVDVIKNYKPSQPPPAVEPPKTEPPSEDWKKKAWTESVRMQKERGIQLNAGAAIQRQVELAGMKIVQNEFIFEGKTYQAAETYNNSKPRRLYYWTAEEGVKWFNDPT
jgi:hypothetical protein